jgi:hypothetical protein
MRSSFAALSGRAHIPETGDTTILEQIDAVLAAASAPAKRVMLAPERWDTLCVETGRETDAVLIQHGVSKTAPRTRC